MREDFERRHDDEERRYFAEWALRPRQRGPELEAARNSYAAGGYSEEFGYHVRPGSSRDVAFVAGDSPELCPEWHLQCYGTHPGYPERPNPLACEIESEIEVRPAHSIETSTDSFSKAAALSAQQRVVVVSITRTTEQRDGKWRRAWSKAKGALKLVSRSPLVAVVFIALAGCKPPPESPKTPKRDPPEPKSFILNGSYHDHEYDESRLHSRLRGTRSAQTRGRTDSHAASR